MIELWKDIKGYEGMYKISANGDVQSLNRVVESENNKNGRTHMRINGKRLDPTETQTGYLTVVLFKNGKRVRKRVHRLVAQAFISNPENKPQVNHKDGDKKNNNASNLEWVTSGENEKHALENGLKPSGERCGKSKLKLKEVKLIRQRYKKKEISMQKLADEHSVTVQTISAIINRKTWCTE